MRKNDKVRVVDQDEAEGLRPAPLNLDILFEDEDLIVVNKPPGLVVHPGAGETGVTLVEALLHRTGAGGRDFESERPGVVHRLDKDTSGVIVWAKSPTACAFLAEQFKKKTNKREYFALVDGAYEREAQVVESYLHRDPRNRLRYKAISIEEFDKDHRSSAGYRYAKSQMQAVALYSHRFSLLKIILSTGRTHQIRVHCHYQGVPILGDPLYGKKNTLPKIFPSEVHRAVAGLTRQMLHAATLGFFHPKTQEFMEFKAPFPEDFSNLLGILSPYKTEEI